MNNLFAFANLNSKGVACEEHWVGAWGTCFQTNGGKGELDWGTALSLRNATGSYAVILI